MWSIPIGLTEEGGDAAYMVYGIAKYYSFTVIPLLLSEIPNTLAMIGVSSFAPLLFESIKGVYFLIVVSQQNARWDCISGNPLQLATQVVWTLQRRENVERVGEILCKVWLTIESRVGNTS